MLKLREDQAAGLRRMMMGSQPKIISVLSADALENRSYLVSQLAASIGANHRDVLILNAALCAKKTGHDYGLDRTPSLHDVVFKKTAFARAVKTVDLGFSAARLVSKTTTSYANIHDNIKLNSAFKSLAALYEVVLVDASLDAAHQLPLQSLNAHDIVIQLTGDPRSIKSAYLLIKKIGGRLGKKSLGIIVANTNPAQAATIFNNIAEVTRRFMQIELIFYGAIPKDAVFNQAVNIGRAVMSAFPVGKAAKAISQIAHRLHYSPASVASAELAAFI